VFDFVGADRKWSEPVFAAFVGHRGDLLQLKGGTRGRDGDARQNGAAFVGGAADDARRRLLTCCSVGRGPERKQGSAKGEKRASTTRAAKKPSKHVSSPFRPFTVNGPVRARTA